MGSICPGVGQYNQIITKEEELIMAVSPVSKNQWAHIGKVLGFIVVSVLIAEIPALLSNNQFYLTLSPAINVVLVYLKELFTTPDSPQL